MGACEALELPQPAFIARKDLQYSISLRLAHVYGAYVFKVLCSKRYRKVELQFQTNEACQPESRSRMT